MEPLRIAYADPVMSITLRRWLATRSGGWRGRAPLALFVAGCVTVVTVAVSGAGEGTPGLGFLQSGHWVYNSALGTAFHIDGGTKRVDGQVDSTVPIPAARWCRPTARATC